MLGFVVAGALLAAACGGSDAGDSVAQGAQLAQEESGSSAGAQLAQEESDSSAGAPGGEVDPCALVTEEEIAEIWGAPVSSKFGPHAPSDLHGWVECTWEVGGGDLPDQIIVRTHSDDGKALHNSGRPGAEYAAFESTAVDGIGDDAYIAEKPSPAISVLEGEIALQIQYCCAGDQHDKAMDALPRLAQKADARL